jgi:hypothetical protein
MRVIAITFSIIVAEFLLWLLLFIKWAHYAPELSGFVFIFPVLTPIFHIILVLASVKLQNRTLRQLLQYTCYINCVVWPITIVCTVLYFINGIGNIGR